MAVKNELIKRIIVKKGRGRRTGYLLKCFNKQCKNTRYVKKCIYESAEKQLKPRIFCCSIKCLKSDVVKKYFKELNVEKYGVENQFQRTCIKEKIKKINKKKLGVENPSQSPVIWKKIRKTWTKNYGVDHPLKNKSILDKVIKTRNERYPDRIGYCNRIPTELSNLEKYGNKYFFASDSGKMTLDNFISWYGKINGPLYHKKRNESCAITLNNMINLYGVTEGNIRYQRWKELCKNTLENFIKRYGVGDGSKKYAIYCERRIHGLLTGSISKFQKSVTDRIIHKFPTTKTNYILRDETRLYFYDICLPEKYKMIEINGDFWHANPVMYLPGQMINFPGGKQLADFVWEKDAKKIKLAEDNGFSVLSIWENDYKLDEIKTIRKINEFLGD